MGLRVLNPMSTMRVPLAAEPEQGQSFAMASWLARLVLVLFAALVIAAVVPRFSTALPAMELGASDLWGAESAVERCCSNANKESPALSAMTKCMVICPAVAVGLEAGMVAEAAASKRPRLARWRGLSDREIEPALRPPRAGLQG